MGTKDQTYLVSARKYRPATFGTVVGQESLTRTLKNAIDGGRLAQAYLFCGPRGVGKTSCARIFAKTINCLHPTADGEACGECESCRSIEEGASYNIIELDAASNNSVDDIRNLTDQVNIAPQVGRYRVFIIDEVHMLSSAAFNAFLKTLEEPPKYVIFILATTEKHKVIPTILSRCQIYDFKRITIDDTVKHLQYVASQEGVEAEAEALNVIARKADGAMRDALSIFDQIAASSLGHITYRSAIDNLNVLDYDYYFRLIEAFKARDVQQALLIYKEIRDRGFDSQFFINGLAGHIRDLMVSASPQTAPLLEAAQEVTEKYIEQARSLPLKWYYEAIEIVNRSDLDYRTVSDKRLHTELCLIRLCRIGEPREASAPAASATPQQPRQATPPTAPQAQRPTAPRAAATTSQPASQPPGPAAPRTATPPPRVSTSGSRPSTFRLSKGPKEQPAGDDPEAAMSAPQRAATPFTDEQFAQAWQKYIAANRDKHLLATAMRNAKSARVGETHNFIITVESEAARSAIIANLTQLLEWLRKELANDMVALSIEIDTTIERKRRLTPREFAAKVMNENPVIRKLLTDLDFEMI